MMKRTVEKRGEKQKSIVILTMVRSREKTQQINFRIKIMRITIRSISHTIQKEIKITYQRCIKIIFKIQRFMEMNVIPYGLQ